MNPSSELGALFYSTIAGRIPAATGESLWKRIGKGQKRPARPFSLRQWRGFVGAHLLDTDAEELINLVAFAAAICGRPQKRGFQLSSCGVRRHLHIDVNGIT